MSEKKDHEPFHMSEIDADAPVLPQGANYVPGDQMDDVTFVDIGSIKTEPKIS